MSTEIYVPDELPILMKSGLVHWIKIPTWEKISNALATQEGHGFIRISELGNIVINTAQVEGAYTMQQFEDHCKVKEGQWQCAYRVWHPKRGECQCKAEFYKKERERKERAQREEQERPQTPEERAAAAESLRKMGERSALKPGSIFRSSYKVGNLKGKYIRRSTIIEWEKENGPADVEGLAINEKE